MKVRASEGCLMFLILVALSVGLPLAVVLAGVSKPSWVAIGAALWAGSVLIKILVGALITLPFSKATQTTRGFSAFWGAWSALCELGAVALWFAVVSRPSDLGDAIGLGVGAGAFEVVILAFTPILARGISPSTSGPSRDWFFRWSGVIERISTVAGHVASRGLVWAAFGSSILWMAAAFAFVSFALVDGIATYGSSQGWDWTEPRLLRRIQGFLALVSLAEAAVFTGVVLFWLEA